MDFKYYILETSPLFSKEAIDVSNKSYILWEKIWLETFGAKNKADKLIRDHFLRSDILTALVDRFGNIAGIHLYTFMNFETEAAKASSFFQSLTPETISELKQRGLKNGICMEYLSVAPEYRKTTSGIPFGELLIGLGFELMKSYEMDCVFGTSREDVKVDRMAASFGGYRMGQTLNKYDYPCRLTVIPKWASSEHGFEIRDNKVAELWASRVDLSQYNRVQKVA